MSLAAAQVAATLRLVRDLPAYVRDTVDVGGARRVVRVRLERRDRAFVERLATVVYADARSPHRRLLRHAGCELGDVDVLVRREGVEGVLTTLARAGVSISQDELKGRVPVVRGSLSFATSPAEFFAAGLPTHFVVTTSGSTGRPVPVGRALQPQAATGDVLGCVLAAHGIVDPVHVLWHVSPGLLFMYRRIGQPIVAWLNPIDTLPPTVRAWQLGLTCLARASGWSLPWAANQPLDEPERMARRLAALLGRHRSICIGAFASSAVRVSHAARSLGVSLRGVSWIAGGEPLTRSRREAICESGAGVISRYGTNETGMVGFGCAARTDTIHVNMHTHAVIRGVPEPGTGPARGLLETNLHPHAPYVSLNTELGDDAELVEDPCDCDLGGLGLTRRLREVRSFQKVTAEGVTIVRADVVRLTEQILPERFGGYPGDYQFVEREGEDGLVRLELRVDPRVGSIDVAALERMVIAHLTDASDTGRYMAELIRRAGSLRVTRMRPRHTVSGKISPFVPLGADSEHAPRVHRSTE